MSQQLFVYVVLVLLQLCKAQEDCSALEANCIRPQGGTTVCSGRGVCECGYCVCNARRAYSLQKYSGSYCECDDYSCPFHFNKICGGHGVCSCGVCRCDDGYTGDNCGCSIFADTCRTSEGKICNGVGSCECGVCKCDPNSPYKGPTCEECPTCPGKCQELKECALCIGFGTGSYNVSTCDLRCSNHVQLVGRLATGTNYPENTLCQFRDDDDCLFFFTYTYVQGNKLEAEVQRSRECPKLYSNNPNDDQDGPGGDGAQTKPNAYKILILLFGISLFC